MSKPEGAIIRLHEDAALFREAVSYTVAETGFSARLVEKDYFCTVLLSYLAALSSDLVFKGGTSLAKVHADFCRMSEDLDFAISLPSNAKRTERSLRVANLKKGIEKLPGILPVLRIRQPLKGANASTQYLAEIGYASLAAGGEETIKLEVSLREPLLAAPFAGHARTILLNPVTSKPFLAPVAVQCLSFGESFAEKFRAALSRCEPAIRDFFDIDYAVRKLGFQADAADFVALVRKKMAIPGNLSADISSARLDSLRRQVEAQLKPVLRDKDFKEFELVHALEIVSKMAERIGTIDPK